MKTTLKLVASVAVAIAVLACAPSPSPEPAGTLTLVLVAGPVCPVVREPPDPGCAPRPVAGEVVALMAGDREVGRGTSDGNGRIHFSVPYGRYVVHPVSDGGFPTPPADQAVDIGPAPAELMLDYDTGIR